MKVWLDDVRPMPPTYDTHVKTPDEAIALLKTGEVTLISLDHDLGENVGTGYDVAKWIEEAAYHNAIIPLDVRVHSANPVGARRMREAISSANRMWEWKG